MIWLWLPLAVMWVIIIAFILPRARTNVYAKNANMEILHAFGYQKIRKEAKEAGIDISPKDFLYLIIISLSICIVLTILVKSIIFIVAGAIIGFFIPRLIFRKIKFRKRRELLYELPSNMKMLVAKLKDFNSIERALGVALPDMYGETKKHFERAYHGLVVKEPIADVMREWQESVRLNKFTDFTDKLLIANEQGFHEKTLSSLKESIEYIGYDVQLIKKEESKTRKRYQRLYTVIGASWAIPAALSTMNVDNANIYLDTFWGQIYTCIFFLATIFCIVKGDEYLTMRLDDL